MNVERRLKPNAVFIVLRCGYVLGWLWVVAFWENTPSTYMPIPVTWVLVCGASKWGSSATAAASHLGQGLGLLPFQRVGTSYVAPHGQAYECGDLAGAGPHKASWLWLKGQNLDSGRQISLLANDSVPLNLRCTGSPSPRSPRKRRKGSTLAMADERFIQFSSLSPPTCYAAAAAPSSFHLRLPMSGSPYAL